MRGDLDYTSADYVQENLIVGDEVDTLHVAQGSIQGNLDSITGFDASSDTLDIGRLGDFTSVDVSQATSLEDAFAQAAGVSAANGNGYVAFEMQGNTYVYADSETQRTAEDGSVTDETGVSYHDFSIELTGIQGAIADTVMT